MTPRDFSQVPVEQLARLLLDRARHDPGLPRRTPANSNEPPLGWSAPPLAQPCRPRFPERLAEQPPLPGQDRIADLVSQALTAAEEAGGIALSTRELSRRANRGAAIAMALGMLGIVAGFGAGLGSLMCDRAGQPTQAAMQSAPAQPVAAPAASITSQAEAVQRSSASPGPDARVPAQLPTLAPATYVRVLPAVPSPSEQQVNPQPQQGATSRAGFRRIIGVLLRQRVG